MKRFRVKVAGQYSPAVHVHRPSREAGPFPTVVRGALTIASETTAQMIQQQGWQGFRDERSGELAETIRSTSATAMSELHDMLRALRDNTEDEPAAASTAGIADLVDGAVRSSASVRLTMPDPVPDVAPVVGRRLPHGAGSPHQRRQARPVRGGRVTVREDGDDLTLTVTNRRSPRGHAVALPSSGVGLVGMALP